MKVTPFISQICRQDRSSVVDGLGQQRLSNRKDEVQDSRERGDIVIFGLEL